jgi:hypothetical protein
MNGVMEEAMITIAIMTMTTIMTTIMTAIMTAIRPVTVVGR